MFFNEVLALSSTRNPDEAEEPGPDDEIEDLIEVAETKNILKTRATAAQEAVNTFVAKKNEERVIQKMISLIPGSRLLKMQRHLVRNM